MSEQHVSLFGFHFDTSKGVADVAAEMMQDIRATSGIHHLITPNAAQIVYYNERRHRPLKAFYARSRYILPDGMPIVWLSRMKGGQGLHRLPGSDLYPELWDRIKQAGMTAVFVLAHESLAQRLGAEHPGCHYIVPRMFDASDDSYIGALAARVAEAVSASNAHFVFLGLGFPKQEKLGIRLTEALGPDLTHPVSILLLGASFEFYFGLKPRAPQWMQRNGLEWFHRLMQEPGRLWKRYTVDNVRFMMLALGELFRRRPAD